MWEMDFGMRFCQNLVLSICEGAWFLDLWDILFFRSIIQFFTPIIDHIATSIEFFNSNLPRFLKKIILWSNLAENLISSISKNIYGFFL